MGRDIIFKTNEYVFSYRVAGVLLQNGKVLLRRIESRKIIINIKSEDKNYGI